MKRIKAITAILLIIFTLFSNIGIFTASAEELSDAEREEIIETVRKSYSIYNVLVGYNDTINYIHLGIDEEEMNDGLRRFLKNTSDIYPEEFEWISIGPYYIDNYNKTKFKSKQELKDYADTVFLNNVFDVDDILYGCPRYQVFEDGYLYIRTSYPACVFEPDWDVDNFVDMKNNDGDVTVTFTNYSVPDPDYEIVYGTAKLKKIDGKWIVYGGSIFDQTEYNGQVYRRIFAPDAPKTGENTVLYIAIASAALVSMVAMVVRRKKREIM